MSSDIQRATARLSGLYIYGKHPSPEVEANARRELAAAKIERAVREAIAKAPRLTDEQRERIAALLVSGTS